MEDNSGKLLSYIVAKRPIKWDTTIIIDVLAFDFDDETRDDFVKEMKKAKPWLTLEDLDRICAAEIVGRNTHIVAMETLMGHYTAVYHDEDIEDKLVILRKDMADLNKEGHNLKYNEAELREKAKGMILHDLIYEDLAKAWGIEVTREELMFFLKFVFARAGNDISEYMNNPKAFERARREILASQVGNQLRKRFKPHVTVPKYRKYADYIAKNYKSDLI